LYIKADFEKNKSVQREKQLAGLQSELKDKEDRLLILTTELDRELFNSSSVGEDRTKLL
jgi:hypothetical protein